MAYETILYDVEGAAAYLTLNRPQKLNAMNTACLGEMRDALERARGEEGVRVVVIRGAGDRAFSAGADISELLETIADECGPVWFDPICNGGTGKV